MNMYYYHDLEDNKEAAQTFFGMNNKSSSTLHYNSVRRFLYFVDCAQCSGSLSSMFAPLETKSLLLLPKSRI